MGDPRSIVVVDDDEWVRRGRVHALCEWLGPNGTVVGLTHDEALAAPAARWTEVDTVVVDAHDSAQAWDKFVGCRVARVVREHRSAAQTGIVMITGHAGNERLRGRAAAAGVDWLFAHDDVRSAGDLWTAIVQPSGVRLEAGVAGQSVEAALDEAGRPDHRRLFEPGVVQKQVDLSRRQVMGLRSRLGRLLRLGPRPPLREIVDAVNEARGAGSGSG